MSIVSHEKPVAPAKIRVKASLPWLNLKHRFCRHGVVSTVTLPFEHVGGWYETCVFFEDKSDVVRRYRTMEQAVAGHYETLEKVKQSYAASGFVRRLEVWWYGRLNNTITV